MADTLILALLFFVVLLFLYYASGDVNDNESDNKEFEIDDLALHEKYKIKFSGRLSAKASQNLERVLSLLPEKVLTSAESLNIDRHFERYQPDNIGQCSYRDRKIDIHPNYIMYALIHEFAHARTFKVICDDIMANKMIEAHQPLSEDLRAEIARETEDAIVDVLVSKTMRAAEEYGARTIIVGGGVSANKHLREQLTLAAQNKKYYNTSTNSGATLPNFPEKGLATDNAIMIALAGYFHAINKEWTDPATLHAEGSLHLS